MRGGFSFGIFFVLKKKQKSTGSEKQFKFFLPSKSKNSLSKLLKEYEMADKEVDLNETNMILTIHNVFEEVQMASRNQDYLTIDDLAFLANFVKVLAIVTGVSKHGKFRNLNLQIAHQILNCQIPSTVFPNITEFHQLFQFFVQMLNDLLQSINLET